MSFAELASYINDLKQSGFDTMRLRVQLNRKLAYPAHHAGHGDPRHPVRACRRQTRRHRRLRHGHRRRHRLPGCRRHVREPWATSTPCPPSWPPGRPTCSSPWPAPIFCSAPPPRPAIHRRRRAFRTAFATMYHERIMKLSVVPVSLLAAALRSGRADHHHAAPTPPLVPPEHRPRRSRRSGRLRQAAGALAQDSRASRRHALRQAALHPHHHPAGQARLRLAHRRTDRERGPRHRADQLLARLRRHQDRHRAARPRRTSATPSTTPATSSTAPSSTPRSTAASPSPSPTAGTRSSPAGTPASTACTSAASVASSSPSSSPTAQRQAARIPAKCRAHLRRRAGQRVRRRSPSQDAARTALPATRPHASSRRSAADTNRRQPGSGSPTGHHPPRPTRPSRQPSPPPTDPTKPAATPPTTPKP